MPSASPYFLLKRSWTCSRSVLARSILDSFDSRHSGHGPGSGVRVQVRVRGLLLPEKPGLLDEAAPSSAAAGAASLASSSWGREFAKVTRV